MGCGAAKKTARSDTTEKESTEQITERKDITRETTITDTTITETGETIKTTIEFSRPTELPTLPPGNMDPGLYEQFLYFQLLSRINKIEQEITRSSQINKGTTTQETETDKSEVEANKTETQKEEVKESSNDPVEITPGWVKGARTVTILIIVTFVIYLFIRYGRHLIKKK